MKKGNKLIALLLIMVMLICDCMPALADDVNSDVPAQDDNTETVEHVYAEPVFTWNEYESCTVTFTCTSCEGEAAHEEVADAVITSVKQDATCLENGKVVYTASVTFNEAEYTDVKEEVLLAPGHNYVNDVCENCGDELKPESVITMPASRTVTYSGKGRTLKVTEVEGSTGEITYQYYTDKNCTTLVTKENSGAKETGLYPSEPGIYYVVATVAADDNYRETVSEPAKLTIKPRVVPSMKGENKVDGVKLTWGKVEEADGYILYRRHTGGENEVLKTFNKNTILTYKDTTPSSGVKYYYNIVSFANDDDGTKIKSNKRATARVVLHMVPTLTNVYNGVKVSWKLVNDSSAKGFYIYRKVSGESKYKKIATINEVKRTNSWTDKNVTNGKKVYYYVQAYYGKSNNTVRKSVGRKHFYLSRPKGERDGDYVKWNRNSKADGYEVDVQHSQEMFDYVKKIESNKTTKCKIEHTSFIRGFEIRSYKEVDGKMYYSAWSKFVSSLDLSNFR